MKFLVKNNLRKIFVLTVFCIALGGAASVFGQIKTGGYRSVSVNDQGVKDAADFAKDYSNHAVVTLTESTLTLP